MDQEVKDKVSRGMTISDILGTWPQKSQKLAQEMTSFGLHCAGCGAATWETLEAGMLGHGMTEEEIEELVGNLNAILAEEQDLTTIAMTKRAALKFQEICKEDEKEGWALRFSDKAGGCSGFEYVLDFSEKADADDIVFTSHGVEIHVEKEAVRRLIGSEIDYFDGLNGAGFKVTNPNVKGSCSCGSSQSY